MYPPFEQACQLDDAVSEVSHPHSDERLPGQPLLRLQSNPEPLFDFLDLDICTKDLDRMAPYLWLVSTPSSARISPLHYQKIKGREIVITEDPRLHLIWIDARIFIKPMPKYLLSYHFWTRFVLPRGSISKLRTEPDFPEWDDKKVLIAKAALGLMRSYAYLIRYSSDLDLAIHHRLLPSDVTYEAFSHFAARLRDIQDTETCPRYQYGELRLSRLNIWSKFLLGRWHYEPVYRQSWQYFQRFYGPLLFAFAAFSVLLGAMQVEMNVEQVTPDKWPSFWTFSRGFSVFSVAFVGLALIGILFLLFAKLAFELRYSLTHQSRR